MKHMSEDEYWHRWEEKHPDSKRDAAKRRFRAKPYQLEVLEKMKQAEQQTHK